MADSEDEIDIGSIPIAYRVIEQSRFVSLGDISMIVSEIYRQAHDIGWETKAIDVLQERLVSVRKYKKP